MDTTASYSAACRIAKLRVGCTVAGCAPGVPRMVISSRFQSTADCPEPDISATDDRGPDLAVAASAGAATPTATAAAATTARIFPVLRMLAVPLDWGQLAAAAGVSPGRVGRAHLLARVVLDECSPNERASRAEHRRTALPMPAQVAVTVRAAPVHRTAPASRRHGRPELSSHRAGRVMNGLVVLSVVVDEAARLAKNAIDRKDRRGTHPPP